MRLRPVGCFAKQRKKENKETERKYEKRSQERFDIHKVNAESNLLLKTKYACSPNSLAPDLPNAEKKEIMSEKKREVPQKRRKQIHIESFINHYTPTRRMSLVVGNTQLEFPESISEGEQKSFIGKRYLRRNGVHILDVDTHAKILTSYMTIENLTWIHLFPLNKIK